MTDKTEQFQSHPLKWKALVEAVERSGMENPDIWIEDLRRYGPCSGVEPETLVCGCEETDMVEASFSVIRQPRHNRIIIRHHY